MNSLLLCDEAFMDCGNVSNQSSLGPSNSLVHIVRVAYIWVMVTNVVCVSCIVAHFVSFMLINIFPIFTVLINFVGPFQKGFLVMN